VSTSDKIESGYWERYLARFRDLQPSAILELGVLEGASLDLWATRFPGADVVGLDRDPPPSTDTWTTYEGQQEDVWLLNRMSAIHGGWDLVVDDCEHVGAKSALTFRTLWPHVRPGGCYVVEDWGTGYWPGWADYGTGHSMVDFTKSLVDLIEDSGSDRADGVRAVEFVPGQCFVWKR
jgi:hypothetical protein